MLYFLSISTILYFFFLAISLRGMLRSKLKNEEINQTPFVSVIVAFRNEKENLPQLFEGLSKQDYPNCEWIFVNDFSSDHPPLSEYLSSYPKLRVLDAIEEGKKAALHVGVSASKGELLLFTDADCVPPPTWISEMVGAGNHADLVCGPVLTKDRKMESWDQLALSSVAAGFASVGIPMYASGANMLVRKAMWLEHYELGQHKTSGDDVFLLHALHHNQKKIVFPFNEKVVVWTQPSVSLNDFFRRRLRWAGKSTSYTYWPPILLGFVTLTQSLVLWIGLCYSLIHPQMFGVWLICLLAKVSIDFLLLFLSNRALSYPLHFGYWIPAFLFNLFYVPLVGILMFFVRVKWKGRAVN
jgi:cellulose synthase/poly-beta-1,6-N-acetylglucosamine synthase-like glycosyltransferase